MVVAVVCARRAVDAITLNHAVVRAERSKAGEEEQRESESDQANDKQDDTYSLKIHALRLVVDGEGEYRTGCDKHETESSGHL